MITKSRIDRHNHVLKKSCIKKNHANYMIFLLSYIYVLPTIEALSKSGNVKVNDVSTSAIL